jgi:UDP-glucose 4-epimerase
LWDAVQKIARGESKFFGTGEEIRDWLHVEDAARLLITAASYASTNCPIVNGGSGVGVSVREILTELFICFERTDAPNFSGATRSGDPAGYQADISIARCWGWNPEVNWHAGLCSYTDWFKSGAL